MDKLNYKKQIKNSIAILLTLVVVSIAICCFLKETRSGTDAKETRNIDMDTDENVIQSLAEVEEVYYPEGVYVELGEDYVHPFQMFQRDKQCWFLLPAYAEKEDIRLFYNEEKYEISIDGQYFNSGMVLSNFEWEQPYSFLLKKNEKEYEYEILFMHSENLPAVYISTKSGSMDYIYKEKGNAEPGKITIILQDGTKSFDGSIAEIKGRGNYSWSRNKKSFVMDLGNESDLLNMGEASKWILLSNVDDGSYLRNKITFDVAKELGIEYVTDAEFIDLYLNGEYAGNYYLCEKVEVSHERIQLQEGDKENYLIELDNYLGEDSTFISESGVKVSIHYPKNVTSEQNAEIAQMFQSIENAVLASDGIDSITGKYYTELIDIDGLTKRYLIDEMGKLDDGWDGSSYWYTQNDGKLYAGPVWDYELSLGNVPPWFKGDENPKGFREIKISNWYAALYKKDDFYKTMIDIYNTQMVPILNNMIEKRIDEYANSIYASARMDRIIYQGKNFYLPYESLDGQIKALKDFIVERMRFFDEVWNQGVLYHEVCFKSEDRGVVAYYYVKDGEHLETLPMIQRDGYIFIGWYYSNGQEYNSFYPIYEDMTVVGRWREQSE